ncbi:MAG: type I glyceraldehyde-3-phosphate dehydrogenase [Saprospiraceae bacterium]|nr:type I glyceraldehyde-3-phosphate dehydrogenase [Saprospiraceae bacterium]
MMKKKIAINGFGRIGRLTYRALRQHSDVELVAINDLTDTQTLAHLLKYDTAHRQSDFEVSFGDDFIMAGDQKILAFAQKDPSHLPWKDLGIDIVLECTGIYLTAETAGAHLTAGAKKVILSAPPKDDSIPTFVFGVNHQLLDAEDKIISNASCTTNCLAPIVKFLNETWGLEFANMITIHAYTQDQKLQDAPHKDLRRARAAAQNVIPTSTGANKAVAAVYPPIQGKLFGSSYRVPVITGSLIELFCKLSKNVDVTIVNEAFKKASETSLKGILKYNEDPIVSSDIIGDHHSAIFDAPLTDGKDGLIKLTAWYDNESGYSNRLADMCTLVAKLI